MKLSVVIPVYNGAQSIERLVEELLRFLSGKVALEIILVNDGSRDNSWEKLTALQNAHPREVIALNLAKNFGEHNAVMAGYHFCTGDFIVNIDDDFQNPPSEILKLLTKIQEGFDVVYSYYRTKQHHALRNLGSRLNDKMANLMLGKPNALYLSSFRLISRALRDRIIEYRGPYPYIDGLILRSTARIASVEVEHHQRSEGTSNYTLVKLLRLWSHAFFNFSVLPLRVATALGLFFSFLGLLGAVVFTIEKLRHPDLQIGWASLIVTISILSGIQLFMMGIIGEYVGRIFLSQNNTPQFIVGELLRSSEALPPST